MRTRIKVLASVFVIALIIGYVNAQAQHGRRYDRNDQNNTRSDYQNRDRYSNNHDNDNRRYDYGDTYSQRNTRREYDRRDSYQCRNNYGAPPWAYHQRTYPRTRYIYFKDSDVYYDCNNSTYITISGRNWSVSSTLPQPMCRMNMGRMAYENVDYYGDNVYEYHTQRYYKSKID